MISGKTTPFWNIVRPHMQNFLKGAAMFANFAGTLSIKGIVWDFSVCEISIKLKKEYSF